MISYNVLPQNTFLCQVETAKKTGVLVFTNKGFTEIPEQVISIHSHHSHSDHASLGLESGGHHPDP